jgi:hypothetical protein
MGIQITQGTQTSIYTKLNSGTEIGIVKLDIGSGTTLQDFGGTMTELTNLVKGTILALASGTLSPIPTIANQTFGTIGTTGATIFGTIAGGTSSGAGTEIFVTSVSITSPASAGSQDVSVGFGTNSGTFHAGTGRLVRGMFPAGGGIQKTFWPPINSGTNAQLTYFQAGAGTIEVDVTFFVTASTI